MDPIKLVELAEELAPAATKLAEETSTRFWHCAEAAAPAAEAESLRNFLGGPSFESPLQAVLMAKLGQMVPRFNPYLYSNEFPDLFADITRAPRAGTLAWDRCTGLNLRPEELPSLATRLGKDVSLKLPEVP